MKSYVILLFLVLVFLFHVQAKILFRSNFLPPVDPIQTRNGKTPVMNKIEQRIDHFNSQDMRTWNMRYLSNDQFFKNGGPLIVFIGGEWAIDPDYLMTGQVFDIAKQHDGYMFYTEHRFYGESFPTTDTRTTNLIYLTVEQALADIIFFINYIKTTQQGLRKSKVIVIGGSYAGTLAAWLRSKFPHVVDISYSSSAPMQAVASYKEYFEVVRDAITKVSPTCLNVLTNSTAELNNLYRNEAGIFRISQLLNTCERVRPDEPHKTYFLTTIIGEAFAGLVQNHGMEGIEKVCEGLINNSGTPFERVANYITRQYNNSCISGYSEFIESYRTTDNSDSLYRSWVYQTCTEFGYFQPTSPPFAHIHDISFNLKMCADIFGPGFGVDVLNNGITRTNLLYGGKNLKISQAVFVYGTIDPWHPLGIIRDDKSSVNTIYVNGTTHCVDLVSISPTDAPEMKAAKTKVLKLISAWLID